MKLVMNLMRNPLLRGVESAKKYWTEAAENGLEVKAVVGQSMPYPMIYVDHEDKAGRTTALAYVEGVEVDGEKIERKDIVKRFENLPITIFVDKKTVVIDATGQKPDKMIATGKIVAAKAPLKASGAKSGGYILTEALQKEVDRVLTEGLDTKENMERKLMYLHANGILKDEALTLRNFRQYRKYTKSPMQPHTLYQDPYEYKHGEVCLMHKALREALGHNAVILKGPKSVGKNVFTDTLAWLMGKPEGLETFSRSMSPSRIYGDRSTDNSAADMLEHFDSEILREARLIHEKHRLGAVEKIVEKVAAVFGKRLSFGEDVYTDEETEILRKEAEFEKLKAEAASVHLKFEASEFYDAITDGWVLALNEMNMAEANFFASFMNPLLDGTGYITFPGRGEVPISKDLVVIGTQNDDYEGTESQNDATISRFGALRFQQPKSVWKQLKAATESKLRERGSKSTLDDSVYKEVEKFYQAMKKIVDEGASEDSYTNSSVTDMCLNIRGLVRALTEYADGRPFTRLVDEIRIHVLNTCPTEDVLALDPILTQLVTE